MTPKHLCILLLAAVATSTVAGQSDDIPIENDNQFPPEKHLETDETIIEGSGVGTIEETTEATPTPQLGEIQNRELNENVPTESDQSCPSQCVCHIEGGSNDFVVDCSGYDLTEFPSPLNPRTTTLNIQNNKLTGIPKVIASLKNLKVLNADNNSIMDLAPGSISELSELTVLKLSNNRLIEFPQDLKNSFSLINLEELDLGGNDMRTSLKPESFSNFKSLRILTLPTSTHEFAADLCTALSGSLETVCTESCSTESLNCLDAPPKNEDDLLDATLPGMIAYDTADDNDDPIINVTSYDNADPTINTISDDNTDPIINTISNDNAEPIINTASDDNTDPIIKTISNDNAEPIINTASDDNTGSETEETPQNDAVTPSTTHENSTQEIKVPNAEPIINTASDDNTGSETEETPQNDAVTPSTTDENSTQEYKVPNAEPIVNTASDDNTGSETEETPQNDAVTPSTTDENSTQEYKVPNAEPIINTASDDNTGSETEETPQNDAVTPSTTDENSTQEIKVPNAEPIINTASDDNTGSETEETPQNDAVTPSTTDENSTQEYKVPNAEPIINTASDDNTGSETEETPQNDAVTPSTTDENSTQENKVPLTSSRVNSPEEVVPAKFNSVVDILKDVAADSSKGISSKDETDALTSSTTDENSIQKNDVSLTRSRVNSPEEVAPAKFNSIVHIPEGVAATTDTSSKDETDVKVGATTADSNNGGVSKSVIGFIVAGMVIAVAGITIKKNWSSIRKRFSSTPRSPERPGANGNANGTAPEEVPLQDKNPV